MIIGNEPIGKDTTSKAWVLPLVVFVGTGIIVVGTLWLVGKGKK
jgi:hypothetical protein